MKKWREIRKGKEVGCKRRYKGERKKERKKERAIKKMIREGESLL